MRTVHDIEKLVQAELSAITLPEIVAAIEPPLVTPTMHMRNWDYGKPGEAYPCWTVLAHPLSNTGIAYSDYGFGPERPWGLIGLATSENWFGMDSGWFPTLEDAFCDSFAVGDLPVWNLVRVDFDGVSTTTSTIIATALSSDEASERRNCLNAASQTDWPSCSVERRR